MILLVFSIVLFLLELLYMSVSEALFKDDAFEPSWWLVWAERILRWLCVAWGLITVLSLIISLLWKHL